MVAYYYSIQAKLECEMRQQHLLLRACTRPMCRAFRSGGDTRADTPPDCACEGVKIAGCHARPVRSRVGVVMRYSRALCYRARLVVVAAATRMYFRHTSQMSK